MIKTNRLSTFNTFQPTNSISSQLICLFNIQITHHDVPIFCPIENVDNDALSATRDCCFVTLCGPMATRDCCFVTLCVVLWPQEIVVS